MSSLGTGSGCEHSGASDKLRLHLFGSIRLETSSGADLTPKSAKICGLLALLATDGCRARTRTWLQDKLWSDRGREQGAASLRQALSQLRRELGPPALALKITRATVALDPGLIEIVLPTDGQGGEFLEGLDARDPEFENWLRNQRMLRSRSRAPIPDLAIAAPELDRPDRQRAIYLVGQTAKPGPEQIFEQLFADCLERSLSESLIADVFRCEPLTNDQRQIIIHIQAYPAGSGNMGIRLSVAEGARRRSVWSGHKVVTARGAPPVDHIDILAFVNETTEVIADALALKSKTGQADVEAAVLARIAVRKIFSMNSAELVAADALLVQAFDLDPRAIFLAWRVQLRVIQRMERHYPESQIAHDELFELMNRALDLEPGNSMVLATAANSLVLIEDDVASGAELARRSLALNSANPFAWDCLSIALLMDGKAEEAHRLQLRACTLSARSPIRHFWDMGACLTSVVTGRHDAALQLAHSASVLVPEFRPPLRYMAALFAIRGEADRAQTALQRLGSVEADFSLRRMVEDGSYPVAALRRSGLLASGQLRDLI